MLSGIISALLGVCFGAGATGILIGIVLLIICLLRKVPEIRQVIAGMIICFVLLVVGSVELIDFDAILRKESIPSSAISMGETIEPEHTPIMELPTKAMTNPDDTDTICNELKIIAEEQLGEGEFIEEVTLAGKELSINVNLGNASDSLVPFDILAESRYSAITYNILKEQQSDDTWEKITVSFADVGYYSNIKDDIVVHEQLGRHFDSDKTIFVPDETAQQSEYASPELYEGMSLGITYPAFISEVNNNLEKLSSTLRLKTPLDVSSQQIKVKIDANNIVMLIVDIETQEIAAIYYISIGDGDFDIGINILACMISIVQTINTNIDAASLVMELMKADNLGTINNTQTIDDVKYGIFIDESLGNFLTIEATLVKDSKDTSNLQSNLSNQIAGQESIVQTTYIGNKNTLVFHEKSCGYLPDRKNQVSLSSRDEAVERGYKACKRCYP